MTFDKSKIDCYNCGKKSHFARDCRQGNRQMGSNQKQQQNRNQQDTRNRGKGGKPQQQKKKMNPQQFKSHIRALIAENFDDPTGKEYGQFLESIEEGF